MKAAQEVGLSPAREMVMLCLEGENRSGLGFQIMSRLAVAGINLRGLSLSSIDQKFAAYLAFDNADVATQAIQVLASIATA